MIFSHVKNGGSFTIPPHIVIVKFDDQRLYIHDGHHRVLAIYLGKNTISFDHNIGGRTEVYKEEVLYTSISYLPLRS